MRAEYSVQGVVRYVRIGECESCGQSMEKSEEKSVDIIVIADDVAQAAEIALDKTVEALSQKYYNDDIEDAAWGFMRHTKTTPPSINHLRDISEAEIMRALGAPLLPGMDV